MLRAKADFIKPDDIPMAITITGTLAEFRALSRAVTSEEKLPYYAVQGLVEQISELSFKLARTVNADVPETENQD